MNTIAKLGTAGLIAFLGIQAIRPGITHPAITAEIQVPAPVKQILRNSCYNCHSNETQLSWFDQIAPAYWLVAHDVKTARSHLNFSEIGKLPVAAQRSALYEAVHQIRYAAMPLPSYRRAHPHAAVSPDQLAVLEQYLDPFAPPVPDAAKMAAAVDEFHQWSTLNQSTHITITLPVPNGLTFFPDYKNWKPISSTDRGDNHTLRQVLGNDIAVKAITDGKTQPWPDGAAFAKLAWQAVSYESGILHAGQFVQVEFMIKDHEKYASTLGWGFGRWRGMDLKPYGKNAEVVNECVGCHKPLRDTDFVFTEPVQRSDKLVPGLNSRVIASSVDRQGRTMSTLTGNDLAVNGARSGSAYPAGAVLTLVTWAQREDPHWFGARIPGVPQSIETVAVTDGQSSADYKKDSGQPDASEVSARKAYILGQRSSVMP
jgi:hypothetical protein